MAHMVVFTESFRAGFTHSGMRLLRLNPWA
jgi:hypothetical protein